MSRRILVATDDLAIHVHEEFDLSGGSFLWAWEDQTATRDSLFQGIHGVRRDEALWALQSGQVHVSLGVGDQFVLSDQPAKEPEAGALSAVVQTRVLSTRHVGEIPHIKDLFDEVSRGGRWLSARSTAAVVTRVLQAYVKGAQRSLQDLDGRLRQLEAEVTVKREAAPSDEVSAIQLGLLTAHARLVTFRRVVEALLDPTSGAFSTVDVDQRSDHERFLKPFFDHLERMVFEVSEVRERARLLEAAEAALRNERVSSFVVRLTVVSVIALPAIMIAGLLGMNVDFWLHDTREGFYVALAAMFSGSLLVFTYLRKRSPRIDRVVRRVFPGI